MASSETAAAEMAAQTRMAPAAVAVEIAVVLETPAAVAVADHQRQTQAAEVEHPEVAEATTYRAQEVVAEVQPPTPLAEVAEAAAN